MIFIKRSFKIALLLPILLSEFFNFLTDLGQINRLIVSTQNILVYPTIENTSALVNRSITSEITAKLYVYLQTYLHLGIAILLFIGILLMIISIRKPTDKFNNSKIIPIVGCTIAFIQYTLLFGAIGADWFLSWMHNMSTLQGSLNYSLPIGVVLVILYLRDD
jgi:predicted small integral membrane protein